MFLTEPLFISFYFFRFNFNCLLYNHSAFFQPHTLFVVPSLLNLLASHSSVEREHLSSVQQVISGAAPSSISLIEKFSRKVGRQDMKIRQGCL